MKPNSENQNPNIRETIKSLIRTKISFEFGTIGNDEAASLKLNTKFQNLKIPEFILKIHFTISGD